MNTCARVVVVGGGLGGREHRLGAPQARLRRQNHGAGTSEAFPTTDLRCPRPTWTGARTSRTSRCSPSSGTTTTTSICGFDTEVDVDCGHPRAAWSLVDGTALPCRPRRARHRWQRRTPEHPGGRRQRVHVLRTAEDADRLASSSRRWQAAAGGRSRTHRCRGGVHRPGRSDATSALWILWPGPSRALSAADWRRGCTVSTRTRRPTVIEGGHRRVRGDSVAGSRGGADRRPASSGRSTRSSSESA